MAVRYQGGKAVPAGADSKLMALTIGAEERAAITKALGLVRQTQEAVNNLSKLAQKAGGFPSRIANYTKAESMLNGVVEEIVNGREKNGR